MTRILLLIIIMYNKNVITNCVDPALQMVMECNNNNNVKHVKTIMPLWTVYPELLNNYFQHNNNNNWIIGNYAIVNCVYLALQVVMECIIIMMMITIT